MGYIHKDDGVALINHIGKNHHRPLKIGGYMPAVCIGRRVHAVLIRSPKGSMAHFRHLPRAGVWVNGEKVRNRHRCSRR